LINDKSRVYEGGSWNDQAQWLNPAARRHMQEDDSSADVGFRCAMTMLGPSAVGKSTSGFKSGK
ncbi:MAG: gliding motility lipoprotein GldJ, partial [Sphingobacteriales bacterium]